MSDLRLTVLRTLAELRAIEDEWEELADRLGAQPFGQAAVACAWWEHLGKGSPLVVTVRRHGKLVGLAPFHERPIGGVPVVRFLGHGMGAVGELLLADADGAPAEVVATMIWDALAEDPRRVLQLLDHRHAGAGLDELRRSAGWQSRLVIEDRCPVVDLDGVADARSFLAGPGRRKLRQNMARADRFAAASDRSLTIDVCTTPGQIAAALPDLRAVHDRAEADHPRQHFLAGANGAFTESLLARAAERGKVAVVVVRLDGAAIGFHVCLRSGTTGWAWLARADPDAADWGAGHLMIREVIDWCIADGATLLDLQLGDDLYKRRWSTGSRDTVNVVAARPGRLAAALVGLEAVERLHSLRSLPAAARPALRRIAGGR